MAKPERSKFRLYVEYIPFYLLYQLIHLLPLRVGYAISGVMFRLLFLCYGKYRKRMISHLLHAKVCGNEKDARKLACKSAVEFGKLLVEIVKMDQLYDPAKIKVTGPQATLDRFFSKGDGKPSEQNFLLVTAHYGNWEVAGTAIADKVGRKMLSIMRPFSNPLIGEMILNHRRSDIHELVDKERGVRQLLKALHDGRIATLLIDQHASQGEGVETVFFGQPCRTHKTPALLHLKTGVPIVPEMTTRIGDNFEFEVEVGDPICYTPTDDKEKDIAEICQLCTTAIEKIIAKHPEQWLWSHRRWLNINRDRSDRKKRKKRREKTEQE